MCGFVVIKSKKITKDIKKSFLISLAHLKRRGPDETRYIQRDNLLIGFTRLSINDLETGSQPYLSNCKRYCVIFNGEIVNYKTLRIKINKLGIKLKFGHEADVILNLYKIYGDKCLKFLRGFFSFVIIDFKKKNIFGAVDRHSIKPLYFSVDNTSKNFMITSDYSSLLKSGLVKKQINYSKLMEFISLGRELDNKTIISNVKKLSQSSLLNYKKNIISIKKYWKPFSLNKKNSFFNDKKLIKKLDENFENLITDWKTSDEKISLCLSSGLDSVTLYSYFKKLNIPIRNYSIYEGKKIKNKSVKIDLKVKKIIKLINSFCKENFNPLSISLSSSTSLFQLYKKISTDKYKVTFNGEGSDEHFGGYERYSKQLRLNRRSSNFSHSIIKTYEKEINLLSSILKNKSFDLKKKLDKKIKSIKLISKKSENRILEFDQLTWIPMLIQRHDMIGMHFGLEVRPPFLDHILVEHINTLPVSCKFDGSRRKIILYKLLKKTFSYKLKRFKIGTPTIFSKILKDKKEKKLFKKSLDNPEILKIFNKRKIEKIIDNPKNKEIFLWRLYIFSKMMRNFK